MDLWTTAVLLGVIANLKRAPRFLLDRYFPTEFSDPSEEIHFDMIPGKRRIAPFVSPLVEGKVMEALGRKTMVFKPAYVKPKTPVDSRAPFRRAVGERIGGGMSPEARQQAYVAQVVSDHIDMIDRRLEVMASEALRTGKVVVSGEGYQTVTVDFSRTAGNTIAALAGTARWGQSAAFPSRTSRTGARWRSRTRALSASTSSWASPPGRSSDGRLR
jgi:hypothetical protein